MQKAISKAWESYAQAFSFATSVPLDRNEHWAIMGCAVEDLSRNAAFKDHWCFAYVYTYV